jgi:ligand-binding sensor domain-containing protein
MNRHYFHNPTHSLLLLFIFFISCNEQTKTKSDSANETKTIPAAQPKIIRTQGSDKNQNVQCGLQDKEGNLWFGTSGEGVYCYDGKSFANFTEKDGLCSNDILSILEDKTGNIWFGTRHGVCRYDPSTSPGTGIKTFTNIPITVTNGNSNASSNSVWSMLQDKKGNIWFGTFDNGAYRYDGKKFTHFLDHDGVINKSGVKLKWMESILEDKAGNIWFGGRTNEGVFCYDGKSIINFKPKGEQWVRPLLQDKTGKIWFGIYAGGVIRYDPEGVSGKQFSDFAEEEINDWIFSMSEDKTGKLWFGGSNNGGVTCYDPKGTIGKSFTYYTTKNGLSNNLICCIVKDWEGNLWFGTKNVGLCRYDPEGTSEKNFIGFSE